MAIVILAGIIRAFAEKNVNSHEFVNEFFNALGFRINGVGRKR